MTDHVGRTNPAQGVHTYAGQPTVVFLTVCSLNRNPILANAETRHALLNAWREAEAWRVGHYVIMPDHIHLFCSPADQSHTMEQWIQFWKRQFRRFICADFPKFQSRGFHHRLRRSENYHETIEYVRANPVRAGLILRPEDWPYQGALNELIW